MAAPLPGRASKGRRPDAGTASSFDFGASTTQLTEINDAVMSFVRSEGEAALAHIRAMSQVRSPSEAIRMQVAEFQRAADASLGCLGHVMRAAGKLAGTTSGK